MKTKTRCSWCEGKALYEKYHDEEWGVPVFDDTKQFEFLVLESAQAGLSWWTILQRREGYRKAFSNFDYKKIAKYTPAESRSINARHRYYQKQS
jgi:DNA-3-methyladenine glycosylase I